MVIVPSGIKMAQPVRVERANMTMTIRITVRKFLSFP